MTVDANIRAQRLANRTDQFQPDDFRFAREFLGLRRTQSAGIVEVDEAQIAMWESGETERDPGEYASTLRILLLERLERGPMPRGPSAECLYACSDGWKPASCLNSLDNCDEHVLPSSLGGRLADPHIDCSTCNNALGCGAHRDLWEALRYFLLFAAAPTGRDEEQAPLLVHDENGEPILLTHGAVPEMPKARVEPILREDGARDFHIVASDPTVFGHVVDTITQRTPDHPARNNPEVVHTIRRPHVGSKTALGGGTHAAAIASVALHMLAYRVGTVAMKVPCLDRIKRFIHAPDDSSYVRWACGMDLNLPPLLKTLVGRGMSTAIAVSASARSGLIVGRMLLLGNIQFEILLATGWTGADVGIAYGVDPNDRREFGPVEMPPWHATITSPGQKAPDIPTASAALTSIWNRAYGMAWERHFRELPARSAGHAAGEVLEGMPDGTPFDPLIGRLVGAVVDIYGAGAFGTPVERKVRLNDLARGMRAADAAVRELVKTGARAGSRRRPSR